MKTSPGDQHLSVRITSSIVGSTVTVSKLEHEDNAQPQFLVGASLLAKAACQPTSRLRMYPIYCGSEPAREGGLTANPSLTAAPIYCGSGLAREGGLTADQFLSGVHIH
ncbi:hypothetical protein QLG10_10095, partial [Pseudomonas sp. V98_8]|uniref:hypothetical protein n=1 Tax=Pseudomonas sp. V98_8 TaxID=3044228 RepID=UPI00249DCA15